MTIHFLHKHSTGNILFCTKCPFRADIRAVYTALCLNQKIFPDFFVRKIKVLLRVGAIHAKKKLRRFLRCSFLIDDYNTDLSAAQV